MNLAGWTLSILSGSLFRPRSIPLCRPDRIDWNHSFQPRTIRVDGNTIFYIVQGEGDPVILIHGFGAAVWVWEKQIETLSRSYRVYAVDLIGHGFSDRPKIAYTPKVYIDFFKEFMKAVGVEEASLVGNSMGGGLAWSVAAFFQKQVKKLILIDCIPPDVLDRVRNKHFRAMVVAERFPFLLHLAIASRNRESIRSILEDCVVDKSLITPAMVDRQYQISRIAGTTWSLYSTFRNASRAPELEKYLCRIERPTLLIWGENDLVFPPEVGERVQRQIPGAKLQIIPNSGHMPMWETPEKVNSSILDFLSGS